MMHERAGLGSLSFADRQPSPSRPALNRIAWGVRREIWENRSILAGPLAVAVFVVFGFMISSIGLPDRRREVLKLPAEQQRQRVSPPYDFAAVAMFLATFALGTFYSVDALQGERRDRSILFWKSIPVSDRDTILSKAAIPLLVLPAIAYATTLATQLAILLWSTAVLLPAGLAASTWTIVPWFEDSLILLYGFVVAALWHAPIFGWLMLVSAWARRAALLWAFFPVIAAGIVEYLVFGSDFVRSAASYRVVGGFGEAFAFNGRWTVLSLSQLTPARFLASQNLWIGLLFALVFLTGAVLLRRNAEAA